MSLTQSEVIAWLRSLMRKGFAVAETLDQLLSSDSGIQAYVESQLVRACGASPVVWRLTNYGIVERHDGQKGTWSWKRDSGQKLKWTIRAIGSGNYDLYYEVIASTDIQAFLLTHSNHNKGLYDARWLIRTAMVIPFRALLEKNSLYRKEPLSLERILSEVCLAFEPNSDWPT